MRIALGSDHRGVDAAKAMRPHLEAGGHAVKILGECSGASCDYPDSAYVVGQAVSRGEVDMGILVCGSGIGMSIAANKVAGVRAALVSDELGAQVSRAHNNANVLCVAGDLIGHNLLHRIVDVWLSTPFEGGRHERRVRKISMIERGENPVEKTAHERAAAR